MINEKRDENSHNEKINDFFVKITVFVVALRQVGERAKLALDFRGKKEICSTFVRVETFLIFFYRI